MHVGELTGKAMDIGDYKYRSLFDDNKKIGDLVKSSEGLLLTYKDLGPVVSQQLIYNLAYIGSTLLILYLYFSRLYSSRTNEESKPLQFN